MKSLSRLLALASVIATASIGQSVAKEPVRINVPNWVGFAPLFVAQERGFFTRHDVAVVFDRIDSAQEFYPLLIDGKFDMSAGTVGSAVLYLKHAGDLQYVTLLDDSPRRSR